MGCKLPCGWLSPGPCACCWAMGGALQVVVGGQARAQAQRAGRGHVMDQLQGRAEEWGGAGKEMFA